MEYSVKDDRIKQGNNNTKQNRCNMKELKKMGRPLKTVEDKKISRSLWLLPAQWAKLTGNPRNLARLVDFIKNL